MKLIYIFLTSLASMVSLGFAHENPFSIQVDSSATANAPWMIGEVVASSCMTPSVNANSQRYKTDNLAIYYASNPFIFNDRDAFWRYIQMFKMKCEIVERRFEGVTTQGYYLVRDYLTPNRIALGASYILQHQEDVKQSAFKTEWGPVSDSTTPGDSADEINQYTENMRTGPWEIFESSGIAGPQKCKGGYGSSSGEREGLWTCWIRNGMMVTQGQYLEGKMHGRWTTWRNQNTINTQGLYINGEKQGWWIETAPGEYRTQGYYQNNLREGVWVTLYYGGEIQSKGAYAHGVRDGCWNWFLGEKNPSKAVLIKAGVLAYGNAGIRMDSSKCKVSMIIRETQ